MAELLSCSMILPSTNRGNLMTQMEEMSSVCRFDPSLTSAGVMEGATGQTGLCVKSIFKKQVRMIFLFLPRTWV